METKHTPGPWALFGDGSVRKPGGVFAEKEGVQGKFICRPDEWEDAKFIAAATDAAYAERKKQAAIIRRYLE